MLNQVCIVGRLGTAPHIRVADTGTTIANLRIAVGRDFKSSGQPDTDWFDVCCFKQTAEFAGNYCHKGDLVSVAGRLQVREYTDREGNKRVVTEIVADRLNNLSPKQDRAEAPAPAHTNDTPLPSSDDTFDPFADA